MMEWWPMGMTEFQYRFQVSTNSKDGSIKFSVICPWAIISITDSRKTVYCGSRWLVTGVKDGIEETA